MKTTGSLLKAAREKRNLSLHEIGMSLKINPKTLQAMEEGELSKLPAKSFLRGFVKSYAIHLKLDPNEILNVFQQEVDAEAKQNLATQISTETNSIEKSSQETLTKQTPKAAAPISKTFSEQAQENIFSNKTMVLSGALILVTLIVFTAKLVEKYQKERVIDRRQLQKIQSSATVIEATKENSKATSTPEPSTALSEISIVPPSISQMVDQVEVKKTSSAEPKDQKKDTKEYAKEKSSKEPVKETAKESLKETVTKDLKEAAAPAVPSTPPAAPAPPAQPPQPVQPTPPPAQAAKVETTDGTTPVLPEAKPTEVIIEALNNVQVKYSLGDGQFETIDLAADQLHTFKSKTVVELDISDGGSVSLIVNGRVRGVPGSVGKPIKLKYPKQ
jgi:cytoskeleton protein RodZ